MQQRARVQLQQLNVQNIQNILGGVGPAPPLSSFQQVTITQLTADNQLLQTQLNQAQVTIGLQQQQITNFQSDIQQLRQENAQLKMDLKLVLMKLNLQGQTPQSSDGGGSAGIV